MKSGVRAYRKKESQSVVAVRLPRDSGGLSYQKWGGKQRAKAGDWLVDNFGDVYSVAAATFAATYVKVDRGWYLKRAPVWARPADSAGQVKTQEGHTRYRKGDYLVSNQRDGRDAYAISRKKFEAMYEPVARGRKKKTRR